MAEIRAVPIAEVHEMAADGRILDPPSICAIYLWEHAQCLSRGES
jgi:hypothetical protein